MHGQFVRNFLKFLRKALKRSDIFLKSQSSFCISRRCPTELMISRMISQVQLGFVSRNVLTLVNVQTFSSKLRYLDVIGSTSSDRLSFLIVRLDLIRLRNDSVRRRFKGECQTIYIYATFHFSVESSSNDGNASNTLRLIEMDR